MLPAQRSRSSGRSHALWRNEKEGLHPRPPRSLAGLPRIARTPRRIRRGAGRTKEYRPPKGILDPWTWELAGSHRGRYGGRAGDGGPAPGAGACRAGPPLCARGCRIPRDPAATTYHPNALLRPALRMRPPDSPRPRAPEGSASTPRCGCRTPPVSQGVHRLPSPPTGAGGQRPPGRGGSGGRTRSGSEQPHACERRGEPLRQGTFRTTGAGRAGQRATTAGRLRSLLLLHPAMAGAGEPVALGTRALPGAASCRTT